MAMQIADVITSPNFCNWHRKCKSDTLWIPHSVLTCIHSVIVVIAEISYSCAHIDNLNQGMLSGTSTHGDAAELLEQVKKSINSGLCQYSLGYFASLPRSRSLMSSTSSIDFVEITHKLHKSKCARPS